MAYNTTVSLDKVTWANYVDFGKFQDNIGHFSWLKNDLNYFDVKLQIFETVDNKEFRLVQNLTMGEPDFNYFMQLRNQLVITAENLGTEDNLSPVVILTISKYMDEQLKPSHKVVDVVDRANRKKCVTLLRYSVAQPESSYAQVRSIARKREDERFQQIL